MVTRDWRAWAPWVGAVAIGVFVLVRFAILAAANWDFTTDDAYITLRYAQNLADGHGIVWNIGESPAVEGYSNWSYVVIGAGAIKLGLDPVIVFKVLGVGALIGTCAALWVLARCWLGPLAATLPALAVTSYVGTSFWVTSGLETPVYQFLVVATLAAFARALHRPPGSAEPAPLPSNRLLIVAALFATAASMTRPEGPLVAIAVSIGLAAYLVSRRDIPWRGRLRVLAAFVVTFGVCYGLYFGWRLLHFGRLLPNSVYCKSLHGDGQMSIVGAYRALALPYLVFAVLQNPRKLDARLLVLLLVPLAYALALRNVDPIIGIHNRHALAAWAVLTVPAAVGLVNLISLVPRLAEALREWIAVAVVVWFVWSPIAPLSDYLTTRAGRYGQRARDREEVGEWLARHMAPGDAYVIGDCGVIPYVAGGHAIDAYCLNNREMTLPPIAGNRARLIERIFELRPAWIVVHNASATRLNPRSEYGFYPALVNHAGFARYELATKIGSPGSGFQYWIYRRI